MIIKTAADNGHSVNGCSDPRVKEQCSNSQVAAACCRSCAAQSTPIATGKPAAPPSAKERAVNIQQTGTGWSWKLASNTAGVVAGDGSKSFPAIRLLEGDQVTYVGVRS